MSHYTVGVGSSPELQRYARQANKARSTALKHALTAIGTRIGHIWRKPTGTPPIGGAGPV